MKSKLDEAKIKTSCKDCRFAKYKGNTQTGCRAGRLEVFGDSVVECYDDDKEFYVITRACNMFRSEDWRATLQTVKTAKKEIELSFAIIIISDKMSPATMKDMLSAIKKIDYDKEKIRIIISTVNPIHPRNRRQCATFFQDLRSLGFNPILMESVHELAREMDSLIKTQNDFYTTKILAGEKIAPSLFSKINTLVNEDLESPAIISCGDMKMVLTTLLNMHYLEYQNYDGFIEAVTENALKHNKYVEINE